METRGARVRPGTPASVLLAFFPFCLVMIGFFRNVLHWPAAEEAITWPSGTCSAAVGAPGQPARPASLSRTTCAPGLA